jgi:signal transduction histidine kinase
LVSDFPSNVDILSPSGERFRQERVLAIARVFLALAVLTVAFSAAPAAPFRLRLSLSGYLIFAASVLVSLGFGAGRRSLTTLIVHIVDLATAIGVMLLTDVMSLFGLLALFAVLTAAVRWGVREMMATAAIVVAFLLAQGLLVTWVQGSLQTLRTTGSAGIARPILESGLFVVAGALIGYVAQKEKRLRTEAAAVTAIVSRVQLRAGLGQTMASVFDAVLRLFGADRAVLVVQERAGRGIFLWEGGRITGAEGASIRGLQIDQATLDTYMFGPPGTAWHAVRRTAPGERLDTVALDSSGLPTHNAPCVFPEEFLASAGRFRSLIGVDVGMPGEWTGRLFLMDPDCGADRTAALALAQRMAREVGPAVYQVYLLRRLRSRSAANERARIARELHDGIIQTVLGVQIQLHALSHTQAGIPAALAGDLNRLGTILRDEALNLRDMIQRLKPLDLPPDQLMDALAEIIQRFERETGISARFITEFDQVDLPPDSCLEVVRVLQEALVNVRKHSGARNVVVRFTITNGLCRLSVDDDGRGFLFAGRLSHAELERTRRGPWVIKDRVRRLGGEITVESEPGHGARLEISFPLAAYAVQQ